VVAAAAAAPAAAENAKVHRVVCSAVFWFLGWREGRTETAVLVKSVVKKCREMVYELIQVNLVSIVFGIVNCRRC
jgi:hypothetical protein